MRYYATKKLDLLRTMVCDCGRLLINISARGGMVVPPTGSGVGSAQGVSQRREGGVTAIERVRLAPVDGLRGVAAARLAG
jgi:hypothetical protein